MSNPENLTSEQKREYAQMSKDHGKSISTGKCLHPSGNCSAKPIKSHTVSRSQYLTHIEENGNVMTWSQNMWSDSIESIVNMERKGGTEASTFPGFCSQHDSQLFESIDAKPFLAEPQQLFEQALRSASREIHAKTLTIEFFLDPKRLEQFQQIRGSEIPQGLLDMLVSSSFGQILGLRDISRYFASLHKIWELQDWSRMQHCVVELIGLPNIAAAGVFTPDYTAAGDKVQDLSKIERDMELMHFSFLPQEGRTYVVLSYLDNRGINVRPYIDSILNSPQIPDRLFWMAFSQLENVCVRMSWWEFLGDEMKGLIKGAMMINANVDDPKVESAATFPEEFKSGYDLGHVFWI